MGVEWGWTWREERADKCLGKKSLRFKNKNKSLLNVEFKVFNQSLQQRIAESQQQIFLTKRQHFIVFETESIL